MIRIDRVVHEPVRLQIMTVLSAVEWLDFPSLCQTLELTRGNLSTHINRLERRRYIRVKKRIIGKIPHTHYRLTEAGRKALANYWVAVDTIRGLETAWAKTEG
jgi:DNA-binding MarR family transcriptional regulator